MSVIDFVRESAKFMCADRPDIYDEPTAIAELYGVIETLRGVSGPANTMLFASYTLIRVVGDGASEEFVFTKKLSSLVFFEEEEICKAYSHTDEIDLPHVLDDDDEVC